MLREGEGKFRGRRGIWGVWGIRSVREVERRYGRSGCGWRGMVGKSFFR